MTRFLTALLMGCAAAGTGCHKMVEVTQDAGDQQSPDYVGRDPDPPSSEVEQRCDEGDSRCDEEMLQLCFGGEWRDYSDCEIQKSACTMVEGAASCVRLPEETDSETETETASETETETDMGPASVLFCNTDFMDGVPYQVRMILKGDTMETSFEATTYCCTECLSVDSGEQVYYELYYQGDIINYGEISLEGSREYVIVTLPDPLDPMIGILDLTKVEEDCTTYVPSRHTRCGEGGDAGAGDKDAGAPPDHSG